MEGSPVDIVVFAPLAPVLGVLLFWFIQLLFIESQKYLLEKIRRKHKPLIRFTNFLGILFQTICHALGYTVTKHGISEFYVSVHYGKVSPKKQKKGVFEWTANAFLFIGPFFIPATMLLICLFFLTPHGFDFSTPAEVLHLRYTFAEQFITFGKSIFVFSENFFGFLINIDLLHPGHFGFLLLLIFLGMGIRPSYIGEEKRKKVDMLYDLRNIWEHIRHRPLYIAILFLLSYIIFYISLWLNQNFYVGLFSVFGWLSIISIVSIIIADLIILLIRLTDEMVVGWKIITYLTLPLSYVFIRAVFFFSYPFAEELTNIISLFFMITCTVLVVVFILKFDTHKFKTKISMKSKKEKQEDGENGR